MPLYPTSFFIPPAGVPFIVEDKYVRGGYRAAANVAERDAIAVAGRKQGMLVRCMDDDTIWELVGGTSNTFWRQFDATKYIKLGAPLILNSGSITLDLSDMFEIDGDGKLLINMTNVFGDSLKAFLEADAADDQKVIVYDHASGGFILKTVVSGGGGTTYSGDKPITVTGSTISFDFQEFLETSLVTYLSAGAADDGKALVYDHATTKFMMKAVAANNARASLSSAQGATAAGATKDFTFATGKTAMLLTLDLSVPDVTVECHSTAARNDANPYRFRSASGKLSDDGISVLEDSSLQYNRRYAFLANLETPTVGTNSFWRIINNSASSQTITVNITYLKLE